MASRNCKEMEKLAQAGRSGNYTGGAALPGIRQGTGFCLLECCMKLKQVVRAAVVVALVSTLAGCWMFMPPGGGGGHGGGHGGPGMMGGGHGGGPR